ncbi:unnamed protein product [Sphagnum balticum]
MASSSSSSSSSSSHLPRMDASTSKTPLFYSPSSPLSPTASAASKRPPPAVCEENKSVEFPVELTLCILFSCLLFSVPKAMTTTTTAATKPPPGL